MRRFGFLVLGIVSVTAGCNLLLTDYETAGAGAAGAGGASPAEGLVLDPALTGDRLGVYRPGFFRLETDAERNWQWADWFYLVEDANAQMPLGAEDHQDNTYYRTRCLWTAARGEENVQTGESFYEFRSCVLSNELENDSFEPTDPEVPPSVDIAAMPVWFTLATSSISLRDTTTTFTTRVFTSGRVWTSSNVTFTEKGSGFIPADIQLNYGYIALSSASFMAPSSETTLFRALTGQAGLLSIDGSPDQGAIWKPNVITDDPTGLYLVENEALVSDVPQSYRAAFVLGDQDVLESERLARIDDIQHASEEIVIAGGEAGPGTESGFDRDTGTYVIGAQSSDVSVDLGTSWDRFEPAMEIKSWSAPTFVIRLNGRVLASDSEGGPDAIAGYTTNGDIAFQYLGTIPANAGDDERKLVITAE